MEKEHVDWLTMDCIPMFPSLINKTRKGENGVRLRFLPNLKNAAGRMFIAQPGLTSM